MGSPLNVRCLPACSCSRAALTGGNSNFAKRLQAPCGDYFFRDLGAWCEYTVNVTSIAGKYWTRGKADLNFLPVNLAIEKNRNSSDHVASPARSTLSSIEPIGSEISGRHSRSGRPRQ